jgi:hypothetical protein
VKARILYDADGTSHMTVTARHISSQLFAGGRALIKCSNGRAVHFGRVYVIDKTPGPSPGALLIGAALGWFTGRCAREFWTLYTDG